MARDRHGKIASLPPPVQEEVNLRLLAGEELRNIVQWLNGHEEVRAMLAEKFEGQPVSIQNLSDWKGHGHREWLAWRESLEAVHAMNGQAGELKEATGGALADQMAEVLMARLMRAFHHWDGNLQSKSGQELMMLRGMCREAGEMRRGSHSGARATGTGAAEAGGVHESGVWEMAPDAGGGGARPEAGQGLALETQPAAAHVPFGPAFGPGSRNKA